MNLIKSKVKEKLGVELEVCSMCRFSGLCLNSPQCKRYIGLIVSGQDFVSKGPGSSSHHAGLINVLLCSLARHFSLVTILVREEYKQVAATVKKNRQKETKENLKWTVVPSSRVTIFTCTCLWQKNCMFCGGVMVSYWLLCKV